MKARYYSIPIVIISLPFCERARHLATESYETVKNRISSGISARKDGKIDPELQKLVDNTAEGAVFRKDLPFPTRLEVRTTRSSEISGRFIQSSAIEKRSESLTGTRIHVTKLERASNQVRYTLEEAGFSVPAPKDAKAKKGSKEEKKNVPDPLKEIPASAKSVTFTKTGDSWKAGQIDGFRAAMLAKELTPVFDQLLAEFAIAPRPLWFGKRRLKPGDQVIVSGDTMPMLLAGKAKGTLTLTLESFEGVAGHPCGVFKINGEYSREEFPDFEGIITDEEVTIQSGKIWLSLLYPVLLREELETIQTIKSGPMGGTVGRGQASFKVSLKREWKRLDP